MIKIGMIIGDRYEILEKIGTGGMSDVYKAKCHKLNRYVAVKVLKQEFSENANFVSKFRVEAQAAAGLMHPNIVNVYDVGEENGIHYIVMELVEGITLKKYIEKKARLSYKEAVSIAIQVSLGIEAAHNNHIIHRDIKPQNIIISKEGKVKVTDFGIAKAATSNTITSNVMGSVHYTSPEQARGGFSDERSDIYSLGVTLFEMLTGHVPFNGETTVAIAIKHIQEEMPSPKEFVPEIPVSVEQIVMKCCQKSPDRRYQSMPEVVEDLKKALLTPEEDFVVMPEPEEEGATRSVSEEEIGEIKRQTGRQTARPVESKEPKEETMRLNDTAQFASEEYDEEELDADYNPKVERITTIMTIVAGLLICGVIIFFVGKLTGMFGSGDNTPGIESSENEETVEMITVSGMTLGEAQSKLKAMGLLVEIQYAESEKYEKNVVISANYGNGEMIQKGTTVILTVSTGSEGIEVPQVQGSSFEDAEKLLREMGFNVKKTEGYSSTVEKGLVISQDPVAGETMPKASTIVLKVSKGQEENKVRMPNLLGLPEDEAVIKLIEAGLEVGTTTEVSSDEYEEGLVCYQSYTADQYVEPGTKIDIRVSMGSTFVYYNFNASIPAPTEEEAPDYVPGTKVGLTITPEGGKDLLTTDDASFPYSVNIHGITAPRGTITFYYYVTTPSETITNEAGEVITIPGTTIQRSFTREVEFTRE